MKSAKKIKQSDSDKMQNHWPEIILMNCLWLILAKTYVPHRWTNMQMGASQMMIETSNKGNGSVAPQHRMHSEMTNEDMMVADQEWSHARGRCISQVSAYSPHHGMKNNYWYTCNICSCLPAISLMSRIIYLASDLMIFNYCNIECYWIFINYILPFLEKTSSSLYIVKIASYR